MRRTSTFTLGSTILLSAFLLFQVQPIISKFILPWFGGGPGVWTTCMVFFQLVLFGGYAYAHLLTRFPRRTQGLIHGALILLALVSLPIAPSASWKPTGQEDPVMRILLLLSSTVGLPYFVLATTSPLVQVWHLRQTGGQNPWRLYALSNVGSLVALLTYPFLVEPALDVSSQTWIWSAAFLVLAGLLIFHAFRDRQLASDLPVLPDIETASAEEKPIRWHLRPLWLLLPALASVLLLAATSHVCEDVAVIPFLWVVPLSLYLISFIITFDHERWYLPWAWALPGLVILSVTAALNFIPETVDLPSEFKNWPALLQPLIPAKFTCDLKPNYLYELGWAFAAMFFGVMLCHGELTRLKPSTKHLTQFYLIMSAGGALGGLCVSLLAPYYFTVNWEWPISLAIAFALAAVVVLRSWSALRPLWLAIALILLLALPLITSGTWLIQRYAFNNDQTERAVRNFYGTISVQRIDDLEADGYSLLLYHGSITHGIQNFGDNANAAPSSYYGHHTGIGIALNSIKAKQGAKVGVIGMGAATVTSYGKQGDTYRIYEINPEIVRLAHDPFTFLNDLEKRGAKLEEVIGDGRLALEREPPQHFDVLLLDAFSGDSVPVHLLTTEALAIYERHMNEDGIIVFNVTNRYLRLKPVLEKVAASRGWSTGFVSTDEEGDDYSTDYFLLSKNKAFLDALPKPASEDTSPSDAKVPLWTDSRHDLFQILVTK